MINMSCFFSVYIFILKRGGSGLIKIASRCYFLIEVSVPSNKTEWLCICMLEGIVPLSMIFC
jgi:hypothetical protein